MAVKAAACESDEVVSATGSLRSHCCCAQSSVERVSALCSEVRTQSVRVCASSESYTFAEYTLLPSVLCAWIHAFPSACRSGVLLRHCNGCHGQPLATAHCNMSKWPALAAKAVVRVQLGHPLLTAHCSTFRWHISTASAHVSAFHSHPTERNHCKI